MRAVNAFCEPLRQAETKRHVRVALVGPAAVSTEPSAQDKSELREAIGRHCAGIERLEAGDIADAIANIVTGPRRVTICVMSRSTK
jgi:NADP-dependent 3-hydroxy acid dehydrogenase YdfG